MLVLHAHRRPISFQLSMREPSTFRGAFLLGGVHYACQTGGLGEFERTVYFHLMDAMRTLSKTLSTQMSDFRSRVLCMNLVAALATVEVSCPFKPASRPGWRA